MTGNEIIEYIKENNLFDKELIYNGVPYGYLDVEEAAKKFNVTVTAVRQWIARDKMPRAIKLGRDWYIPLDQEYPPRKKKKGCL